MPREKKSLDCEFSIILMTTILAKRDNDPSTRCNCSIILLCLCLVFFYLFPSFSRTHPIVSPNGVLHFVIQYVGVRETPPLWIRVEGQIATTGYVRACDASMYILLCFQASISQKKSVSSRAPKYQLCSYYYNHPFKLPLWRDPCVSRPHGTVFSLSLLLNFLSPL